MTSTEGRGEIYFEDIFTVTKKDPDGRKFDKVSRLIGVGEQFEMDLILDVNTSLYPLNKDDKFTLALAPKLSLREGVQDSAFFDQSGEPNLADKYEYVMHGKLYKYAVEERSKKGEIYISFGGLLMMLRGDPEQLQKLEQDQRLYLLIRKVS
eukprot:TRINITY_DN7554_c0_g1_i1.p1 TRINITY_DN7554_c0_g1~~TRINITY_DN7554_c0_g1_i1.p1  ORF type:complete len:152 (-),score=34.14 TRINITY_DN7554_c0_g1_i1:62-517(-)